jgi:hypothetical protein
MRFSKSLEHYMWLSDDEDDVTGSAATAATLAPRNLLIDCQTRRVRQPQCLRRKRPPSHLLRCIRKPRWLYRARTIDLTILGLCFHQTYMVWFMQPVSRK